MNNYIEAERDLMDREELESLFEERFEIQQFLGSVWATVSVHEDQWAAESELKTIQEDPYYTQFHFRIKRVK